MDIDVDKKLYNDYLNGNTESFKTFYLKYKDKIKYFIFGIVKDYEKAEDITQEVFIYILKNKYNENSGSLKYYIYLIAKSKAISYINKEKRRNDITEKYLNDPSLYIENDIFETIAKQETKKDIIESINLINEKFRDSVYLVKIGGLSYKEVADILNISEQDVKNYVHRGKNELRKILIKKGYEKMNKSLKVFIIIMCLSALMAGVIYAVSQVYEKIKDNAEITPTFTSQISTIDTNKVWVGTFNLVWNDFMNDVIKGNIEFEDGYSELAEQLNKQTFTIDQLNANSYFKIHGKENLILKNQIEEGIKKKFNETSGIIDKCDWKSDEYYVLYAMLKKEFNYLEKFPTLEDNTFGNSEVKIKYFGIEPDTIQNASINIEVLFYNSDKDFAIKLKTKEKEEVYLYKTDGIGKSFEDNYKEMIDKQSRYTGEKNWKINDILKIPFIKVKEEINYDELCGRYIKGTNWYIKQALQTVDFELNNYGGSVKSEALIETLKQSIQDIGRKFIFDDTFLLYLKEEEKQPYFALRIDTSDVLVTSNEYENKID